MIDSRHRLTCICHHLLHMPPHYSAITCCLTTRLLLLPVCCPSPATGASGWSSKDPAPRLSFTTQTAQNLALSATSKPVLGNNSGLLNNAMNPGEKQTPRWPMVHVVATHKLCTGC